MRTFVIPYSFLEHGVVPKDELLEELKDCLNYHEDFESYGNGEEDKHVEFFKENFDKIIKGEMELPDDPGLFATIADIWNPENQVWSTKQKRINFLFFFFNLLTRLYITKRSEKRVKNIFYFLMFMES